MIMCDISEVKARLRALRPTIAEIRRITGVPSTSIGVLHEGEVIFTSNEGYRDTEDKSGVDVDTIYLLGSLTKGFIASSCGILVDEGRLTWTTPLSIYVPFHQINDPVISQRANLSDALSHSTGFPQIDVSWYGADGESILSPEDLIHVVNHMPVFPDFRSKFHYSNWMYSLVGRVIEAVGEIDAAEGWGGFIRRRIFAPLHMDRSTTNRERLPDKNIAEPHTVLDDGEPTRLPRPDVSDKTINGASAAVWSTVPDMLSWAKAILDGLENEQRAKSSGNPLRQLNKILAHHFPVTNDTINENTYGFGWARHQMPSTHLGWLSTNGPQSKYILGKESRPRLLFYHGGQITGYLNSIYLFPETKSAVVVLTNAQGLGDASDLTGQAVIQALFDLEPKIDFASVAEGAAKEQLGRYARIMEEYEKHRVKDAVSPPLVDILGTFWNSDIRMRIEVFLTEDTVGGSYLAIRFNQRKTQCHRLRHYHHDTFGFPPASREEQELRCLVDYFVYEQFLLEFQRDEKGKVASLVWRMQPDLPPLQFILESSPLVSHSVYPGYI